MAIPPPVYSAGLNRPGARLPKRQQRKPKDAILGITKPAIRRLARRGGIRRIQSAIYDDVRAVLRARLEAILSRIIISKQAYAADQAPDGNAVARKTITVNDVIFALKRMGTPLYFGFDDPHDSGINL